MLSRGHVSLAAWAAALLALVVPGGSAADLTPTRADVSYGPHASNTLDFWQAAGEGPRPLLVNIHGGGWLGGDKRVDSKQIQPYLDRGVSYASINYRHTNQAPLPAPVHDAARAVQFLKSQATAWQLNKDRIGLIGLSAGACTSMWLLLHDDLADPTASDPVLRESTRVRAAVAVAGQTSIDPPVIESWLGPSVLKHRMISMAVGEPRIEEAQANYAQHRALYVEFSPYNHVDVNDPPLFLAYGKDVTLPPRDVGHAIHHPLFGIKLKEKSDQVGHECHLLIPGTSQPDAYPTGVEFLFAQLLAP